MNRFGSRIERTNFTALGVAVNAKNVFVATDADGLAIFDLVAPPIFFEPMDFVDGSGFRFSIQGPVGLTVRVQRSESLTDWSDWQTVTLGDSPSELKDPEVQVSRFRFYRAQAP